MYGRRIGAPLLGAILSLASTGCGLLDRAETYTNPVATDALLVGLINPVQDRVAVPDQMAMTVFVADARQISSIDAVTSAPVTGADVSVHAGEAESILTEGESGLYYDVSTGGGLGYEAGADYQVRAEVDEEQYLANALAPEPASFTEDRSCVTAGEAVTFHLEGDTYDRLVVTVYDSSGAETWSNLPEDTADLAAFLTADPPEETFELPATAFPDAEAVYGVVVAGVSELGTWSDNLNPLLSRFYVGAGRAGLVGTYSDPSTCDALATE